MGSFPAFHLMMLFLMPQSTARTCTCRCSFALGSFGLKISFFFRETWVTDQKTCYNMIRNM